MAANNYGMLAAQAYRTAEMREKLSKTLRGRVSFQSQFAREMQKMRLPRGMQKVFLRRAFPDVRMTPGVAQGFSQPKPDVCPCFKKKG